MKSTRSKGHWTRRIKEVNELRGCLANVQVPAATLKHEDLYPMKKEPHGICLIINNYTFFQVDEQYERLNDRSGAQKDQENLVETFNFLKYKVELHENLSSDMMVDTFEGDKFTGSLKL